MKLVEINSRSPEKSFEVKSGALRVTDPCYDMETWCAGTLESVKNGKRLDVGVDCHDFAPISYPEVKALMAKKDFVVVDHHKENAA